MIRFIIRRLFMMIPVLLGVTLLVFGLLHMAPGDPAAMVLGAEAEPEAMERFRAEHYLDRPFLEQYFRYVIGLVTKGDMGTSYKNSRSVKELLFERVGNTLQLGFSGVLIMLCIGIPLGIIYKPLCDSALRFIITVIASVVCSLIIIRLSELPKLKLLKKLYS